jgi:Histidine kinase-, DNA gyrase B-, and HSP90-like ATPase
MAGVASAPYVVVVQVGDLDDRSFDSRALAQLTGLFRRLRHETIPIVASRVVIDLRAIRRLFPYAALGLLVLLQGLAPLIEARVRVLLPSYADAPECVSWIAESGFLEAASQWADVECNAPVSSVRNDHYLVPVRLIRTPADHRSLVAELLEKVPYLLSDTFGEATCFQIVTVFSELTQNILSYGATPGFAMLQAFRGIVKFAVADSGPGIPETLKPKYAAEIAPWDDSTAIAFALRAEVTTRETGGGLGLYYLRDVIERQNGILNIRSGRGKLLLARGKEYLYQPRGLYRGPLYFWGTQIGVVLKRA